MNATRSPGRTRGVYLSDDEWAALDRKAAELGTSRNYLLRIALRRLLGLATPGVNPRATLGAPDRT